MITVSEIQMRSYVSNLSAFVAGRMQNGDGDHKITGVKRKDAGTLDVEMQDAKPGVTRAAIVAARMGPQ